MLKTLKRTLITSKSYLPQLTTLSNGLRVLTHNIPSITGTTGVWVNSGSRYESAHTNGVAHYLEHLLCRRAEIDSGGEIASRLEYLGSQLNAYTSKEISAYYLFHHYSSQKEMLKLLSDLITKPQITRSAISSERMNILSEKQQVESLLDEQINMLMHHACFGESTLGRTILGSEGTISSMRTKHLADYHKKNFIAPRMIVAAAGPFEHERVVDLSQELFANLKTKQTENEKKLEIRQLKFPFKGVFQQKQFYIPIPEMPVAHYSLLFPSVGWKDYYQCLIERIIQTNFGNIQTNITSFTNRVMQNQLALDYTPLMYPYMETGIWTFSVVSNPNSVKGFITEFLKELEELSNKPNEKNIMNAKNSLKLSLILERNDTFQFCDESIKYVFMANKPPQLQDLFQQIDQISLKEISNYAQNWLNGLKSFCYIGPKTDIQSVYKIIYQNK
ncbi:hypothetical protein M0812_20925 [Anaeramoeba flamelloides]|uniref:Mitochondrial processing peptidase n=1 Tax=Anaeramoeba flamelloides TaxID=1746091 RepID=A0AAV7YTK1_9EUKA|nr:hypothetical protein M0812_20925 [Anaeramoeba flamelloides]|eukprot:Anaeramoba_flamelloidesc41397_g1_i1.p1 GENE.c41397_g1_i1~~c41397_g1_i1.p1  ORF type:complete len:446 (-),score=93.75 c41397_g1_i1:27-1364(-)